MASQATMAGNWNELKGRVRSKWGQMTDDMIEQCRGNMEALVGTIQRATGETKEKIQDFLSAGMDQGAEFYNQASEAVRAGYSQASQAVCCGAEQAYEGAIEGARYVGESIKAGADQTGKLIQARPLESLMLTFGAGIVAGLALGLILRSR